MKRRKFLKTVAAVSVSWRAFTALPVLRAAELPPYSRQMPATPFDAPRGSWTLVVLPDTQNYSASYPDVFNRQCDWIVAHRKSHHIQFVAHEGDIVNSQQPEQWKNARTAMSILNEARMPYTLVPGNHDLGPLDRFCEDRSTLLNTFFSEGDFASSRSTALLESGHLENNWHAFETPTGPHLMLALEYGPRDAVVEWAGEIAAKHPDHRKILLTHAYLYRDSTRYGEPNPGVEQKWNPKLNPKLVQTGGGVNDGVDLWRKLVSRYPKFQFTLNGHVLMNGTGYRASRGLDGAMVHQILANYQAGVQIDDGAGGTAYADLPKGTKSHHRAFGGGGFLRLMQFHPDAKTVMVRSYSPWYDRWLTQPDQRFRLSLG